MAAPEEHENHRKFHLHTSRVCSAMKNDMIGAASPLPNRATTLRSQIGSTRQLMVLQGIPAVCGGSRETESRRIQMAMQSTHLRTSDFLEARVLVKPRFGLLVKCHKISHVKLRKPAQGTKKRSHARLPDMFWSKTSDVLSSHEAPTQRFKGKGARPLL